MMKIRSYCHPQEFFSLRMAQLEELIVIFHQNPPRKLFPDIVRKAVQRDTIRRKIIYIPLFFLCLTYLFCRRLSFQTYQTIQLAHKIPAIGNGFDISF